MKTVADLKRAIKPGRKITLTEFDRGYRGIYIGIEREIVQVQTNGFYISTEPGRASFLNFPKKSEFIPISDLEFGLKFEDMGGTIMKYKLGE